MHGASSISSSRAGSIGAGPSAYVDVALQREAGATKVAVVGAGFLGKCIAIELSLLGVSVLVCDTNPQTAAALSSFAYELLNPLLYLGYATKSMITRACANIRIVSDISECADVALVIEAIPENLAAKVRLLQSLEGICSASTILASSTIELSIDAIQRELKTPGRFLGVRFFHPCVLLRPVEITPGTRTDQDSINRVFYWFQRLQKVPHRGPTRRVLSNKEVSAFQFDAAVRGNFYHGLLEPKLLSVEGIITDAAGPPLVGASYNSSMTCL